MSHDGMNDAPSPGPGRSLRVLATGTRSLPTYPTPPAAAPTSAAPLPEPEPGSIQEKIVGQIRQVFDPEIPTNVYDLGLIYGIDVDDEGRVKVRMTLTAPGCPVAGELPAAVARSVEALFEVRSADVELVWDPPWDRSRMSEAALLDLGML